MIIDSKKIDKILEDATKRFVTQPSRLYENGKELDFDRKRIISLLEAMNSELDLGLEFTYGKE